MTRRALSPTSSFRRGSMVISLIPNRTQPEHRTIGTIESTPLSRCASARQSEALLKRWAIKASVSARLLAADIQPRGESRIFLGPNSLVPVIFCFLNRIGASPQRAAPPVQTEELRPRQLQKVFLS